MLVTEKYKILENLFPDILSGLTEVIQKGNYIGAFLKYNCQNQNVVNFKKHLNYVN